MSFVLVAKPADHKILFEWVNELTQLGEGGQLTIEDQSKDRCHTYRWVNQVPLNGTKDADNVNFSNTRSSKTEDDLSQQLG